MQIGIISHKGAKGATISNYYLKHAVFLSQNYDLEMHLTTLFLSVNTILN